MDLHTQVSKNMEDIVKRLESRMNHFDKALAKTQTSFKSPPKSNSQDLRTLANDYATFKDFIWKTLYMLQQQLQLLTEGFDKHEMLSRGKVLLFHGLKEERNEQVENTISAVLCDKMKLTNINSIHFDVCHRLGVKKDKPRPVLARFSGLKYRKKVWSSKTSLKGSGVTISEFLTKSRQEVFTAARGHFGVRNAWSSDGIIFVALPDNSRKKLTTMTELKSLISKFPLQQAASTQDPKTLRSRRINKTPAK